MQAAFARFDADQDGVLSPKELNDLNNGTGSGELGEEDLQYLLTTFHTARGGLSALGLAQYFLYALKEDLGSTLGDLQTLALHDHEWGAFVA